MINKQTIFILGAGASVPYGYPTGVQLRQQIIDNLDPNEKVGDDQKLNRLLRKILEEEWDQARDFKNNLLESRRSSIDLFLENRPDFCDIGKLAIAGGIIEFEKDLKALGTGLNIYMTQN